MHGPMNIKHQCISVSLQWNDRFEQFRKQFRILFENTLVTRKSGDQIQFVTL